MPQSATGRFSDPEDYQASLPELTANLVVTQPGNFDARLTWAKLPHLRLLRAQETLARIAYISLPETLIFASFATRRGSRLFWSGIELPLGEMVLHSLGERLHQRIAGASDWGLLAIRPSFFVRYGSALVGYRLEPPTSASIMRPLSTDLARLLRLHARVAHLVETKPITIGHPEVGRALEHELLHALIACLERGEARATAHATAECAAIMVRFEAVLADPRNQAVPVSNLCALIGVPDRVLRTCCIDLLGIGPGTYLRLRRLKLVRATRNAAW